MTEQRQCIHAIISGKVQGVYFRLNTQKTARALGVLGFVRNLPNGTVEVKATALAEPMSQFIEWLHEGPTLARVDNVKLQFIEHEEFSSFEVR